MQNSRLTKRIFRWDKQINDLGLVSTWSSELKSILESNSRSYVYDYDSPFPLRFMCNQLQKSMMEQQNEVLRLQCLEKPKLRTFIKFKVFGELPSYVSKPLSFAQRRSISQLRVGTLPIRLETGRFCRPYLEEKDRLCQVCDTNSPGGNSIENEYHFLFVCDAYSKIRNDWLGGLGLPDSFWTLPDYEMIGLIVNRADFVRQTSNFVIDAFNVRSKAICK